jgi:hypothetical protein
MIGLKVRCGMPSHHSSHRRNGSLPRGKDGARHKDFHVWPYGFRKYRGKDRYDTAKLGRQREHRYPFLVEAGCAFTAYRF